MPNAVVGRRREQIGLRNDTTRVEQRNLDCDRPATEDDFQEYTIEVSEIDNEVVVSKQAEAIEEVVIRKDGEERTQTISDTMRRDDFRRMTSGQTPFRNGTAASW